MITSYRVYDEDDNAVYEGAAVLDLAQDRKGLHVVSVIRFISKIDVTVARIEVDLGNSTWSEKNKPTKLNPNDILIWSLDVHLGDTA